MKCLLLVLLALSGVVMAAPEGGDPVCAKTQITLRKGPGSQYPVSWCAARFMPFLRQESKNGWVRVIDFEGESHWAPARDLSSVLHCVVVKTQVATLRKEPSMSAQPSDLKTVDRYTPLKKIESQGEWVKVEDETGRQAWIHESNIWKPMKVQSVKF